jgi:hypothetical protein
MMRTPTKTAQLQLRVTRRQKAQIRQRATAAGLNVSEWALGKLLHPEADTFAAIVRRIAASDQPAYAFAELHDFLLALSPSQVATALETLPDVKLTALRANQVAAMVETAGSQKGSALPEWVCRVPPLTEPWFASSLTSLRLHLLTCTPPAFRRRNLFVDSTLGDRC